jgi:hypothetical protein
MNPGVNSDVFSKYLKKNIKGLSQNSSLFFDIRLVNKEFKQLINRNIYKYKIKRIT